MTSFILQTKEKRETVPVSPMEVHAVTGHTRKQVCGRTDRVLAHGWSPETHIKTHDKLYTTTTHTHTERERARARERG